MFWTIILVGAAASSIYAYTRGQNPLIWLLPSAAGLPLLSLLPPASGKTVYEEQKRARRQVGDKVGLTLGLGVVGVLGILSFIGIV